MTLVPVPEIVDLPRETCPVRGPDNLLRFPLAPSAPSVAGNPSRGGDLAVRRRPDCHIGGTPLTKSKESPAASHRQNKHAGSASGPISPKKGHSSRRRSSNSRTTGARPKVLVA